MDSFPFMYTLRDFSHASDIDLAFHPSIPHIKPTFLNASQSVQRTAEMKSPHPLRTQQAQLGVFPFAAQIVASDRGTSEARSPSIT
jgi:hypothetical protein